jgi:DNA-binding XRE family transcriptional regulator
MEIPNKLKDMRTKKGLTQEELSQKANVSRVIIVGLENGTIDVVRTSTLTKLAKALNYKVRDIFFIC